MTTRRFDLLVAIDSRPARTGATTYRRAAGEIESSSHRAEASTKRVTSAVGGLGRSLVAFGALGVALKAVSFARESIALATEQAQAYAQVEQAVRSTGGAAGLTAQELAAMASAAQQASLFGDELVLRGQSILLTFTKIGAEVFPRAQQATLDLAQRMGTDLKSAAIQVGKALNDPVTGITALVRSGIQFSDSQKEVIRHLFETGRVAEAQGLILEELETQFGGSAEAARRAAGGGLKAFENALGDIKERAGKPLLDFLDDLGRSFVALDKRMRESKTEAAGWTTAVVDFGKSVNPVVISLKGWAFAADELADALDPVILQVKQAARFNRELSDGTGLTAEAMDKATAKAFGWTEALRDNTAAAKDAARRQRELADAIIGVYEARRDLLDRIRSAPIDPALLDPSAFELPALELQEAGQVFADSLEVESAGVDLSGLQNQLTQAIVQAIQSGSITGAADALGALVGQAIGAAVTEATAASLGSFAGPFGAIVGALAGSFVTDALSSGDGVDMSRRLEGTVEAWSNATEIYFDASQNLLEAAIVLQEVGRNVREQYNQLARLLGGQIIPSAPDPGFEVGGLGDTPPGGGGGGAGGGGDADRFSAISASTLSGMLMPAVEVFVRQLGDELFMVAIPGATGLGESIEDAVRDAFDAFVRALPDLIEAGRISLEGIPAALGAILSAGVVQTLDELKQALEVGVRIYTAAVGNVRGELFTTFAQLAVDVQEAIRVGMPPEVVADAVTNTLRQALSSIAGVELFPAGVDVTAMLVELEAQLRAVGVSGRELRQALRDAEIAAAAFNERMRDNVLEDVAAILERIPEEQERAARIQARVEQARMVIAIELARIQLRTLREAGLIERSLASELLGALRRAREWAQDVANFLPSDTGQAVLAASVSADRFARAAETAASHLSDAAAAVEKAIPEAPESLGTSPEATIIDFFDSLARPSSPLAALTERFQEFWSMLKKAKFGDAVREAAAFKLLSDQYLAALRRMVDGMKDGIRDLLDSLVTGPLAPTRITERLDVAMQRVADIVADIQAGNFDAIPDAERAAREAFELLADAFPKGSAEYLELFNQLREQLEGILAINPDDSMLPPTTSDPQLAALLGTGEATVQAIDDQTGALVPLLRDIRDGVRQRGPATWPPFNLAGAF